MKADHPYTDYPDYLIQERIRTLLDHGYYGYKIQNVAFDDHRGQIIVVAKDNKGHVLSAYGENREDACLQLIDLIDITLDT
jgi:hypothetical protein